MSEFVDRVAQKEYVCKFCGEKILKKEKYVCITVTPWDHPENEGFAHWRVHQNCKKAGIKFFSDSDEGGFYPDDGMFKEFKEFRDKKYSKKD